MRLLRITGALNAALFISGCSNSPSALAPKGVAAKITADLFWLFTAVSAAVWVLVLVALAGALLRRRSVEERAASLAPLSSRREHWATVIISGAIAITGVILIVLTATSYFAGKSLANLAAGEPLIIDVTGHQWWWEIRYENTAPERVLTTDDELHLPAGAPILLKLASADVIHSFWVPELAGKEDLVPGRENYLHIVASTPGNYRGPCAEFCGLQHAHMGLRVIVDEPQQFEAWYERELASAKEPVSDEARLGRDVFLAQPCVTCHKIRGTEAQGEAGPDLTHFGSRSSVAAETLPNTPGSLGGWIADPQRIKPGAKMPATDLSTVELNAIVAYLEGLR